MQKSRSIYLLHVVLLCSCTYYTDTKLSAGSGDSISPFQDGYKEFNHGPRLLLRPPKLPQASQQLLLGLPKPPQVSPQRLDRKQRRLSTKNKPGTPRSGRHKTQKIDTEALKAFLNQEIKGKKLSFAAFQVAFQRFIKAQNVLNTNKFVSLFSSAKESTACAIKSLKTLPGYRQYAQYTIIAFMAWLWEDKALKQELKQKNIGNMKQFRMWINNLWYLPDVALSTLSRRITTLKAITEGQINWCKYFGATNPTRNNRCTSGKVKTPSDVLSIPIEIKHTDFQEKFQQEAEKLLRLKPTMLQKKIMHFLSFFLAKQQRLTEPWNRQQWYEAYEAHSPDLAFKGRESPFPTIGKAFLILNAKLQECNSGQLHKVGKTALHLDLANSNWKRYKQELRQLIQPYN